MIKAISISVLCVSLLSGCALFDIFKNKDEPAIVTPKVIQVDSKHLEECEPLSNVNHWVSTDQSELDLMKFVWIEEYGKCANKQHTSIKVIKELANIKDPKP